MAVERRARIMVVDDHPLFREGLVVALRAVPDFEVVGDAESARETLALMTHTEVDVAVIDMIMPTISGITLASELHERHPSCRVLGLSVINEPNLIADLLRAHACGFALKSQPVSEIIDAIRRVAAGLRYLPPSVSREAIEQHLARDAFRPVQRLTKREREIFEMLIRGSTDDDVAARLAISRRTAETHRQRIMNKLSAHSVLQMHLLAAQYGGLGGAAPDLGAPNGEQSSDESDEPS
jgi:DNA-binding NarL/FixJ family response regulator